MGNIFLRAALGCSLALALASGLRAQQVEAPDSPAVGQPPQTLGPVAGVPAAPAAPKEDWGALPVNLASLQPLSYAIIGTAEHPEYTSELLRIQWRVADPIDLYVIKPHGVKNPPVVIYLYGYPNDTSIFRDDGWCKRATQGGLAAVGFVSALTGQRYASRPMKEWFVSELQESLGTTVHDVQMVLNYLEKRGDLDMDHVGMFGQGSGGAIAALAAEADSRISVLDLLNPWGDWPDWLKYSRQVPEKERAAYLTPEFLKRVDNLDPVSYLPKLKLKGLRVMQVMDDPVTPPIAMEKIAAAVPHPEQLVQYKSLAAYREALASVHSPWMQDQLRPLSPSSGSSQAAAGGNAAPAP
jgi:hypothetical protein